MQSVCITLDLVCAENLVYPVVPAYIIFNT